MESHHGSIHITSTNQQHKSTKRTYWIGGDFKISQVFESNSDMFFSGNHLQPLQKSGPQEQTLMYGWMKAYLTASVAMSHSLLSPRVLVQHPQPAPMPCWPSMAASPRAWPIPVGVVYFHCQPLGSVRSNYLEMFGNRRNSISGQPEMVVFQPLWLHIFCLWRLASDRLLLHLQLRGPCA